MGKHAFMAPGNDHNTWPMSPHGSFRLDVVEWSEISDKFDKIDKLEKSKADASDLKATCRDVSSCERRMDVIDSRMDHPDDGLAVAIKRIRGLQYALVGLPDSDDVSKKGKRKTPKKDQESTTTGNVLEQVAREGGIVQLGIDIKEMVEELQGLEQRMLKCIEGGPWKKAFLKDLAGDLAAIDGQVARLVGEANVIKQEIQASQRECRIDLEQIRSLVHQPSPEFLAAVGERIIRDANMAVVDIQQRMQQAHDLVVQSTCERLASENEKLVADASLQIQSSQAQLLGAFARSATTISWNP